MKKELIHFQVWYDCGSFQSFRDIYSDDIEKAIKYFKAIYPNKKITGIRKIINGKVYET